MSELAVHHSTLPILAAPSGYGKMWTPPPKGEPTASLGDGGRTVPGRDAMEGGAALVGGTNPRMDQSFAAYVAGIFRDVDTGDPYEVAKAGAQELVATALVLPILQMMRNDPLKSDLFGDSVGERTFGPLLDAEIANSVTRGAHIPLVDALARGLLKRRGYEQFGDRKDDTAARKVDEHA